MTRSTLFTSFPYILPFDFMKLVHLFAVIKAEFVRKYRELRIAKWKLGYHFYSLTGFLIELPVEDASFGLIVVLLVRSICERRLTGVLVYPFPLFFFPFLPLSSSLSFPSSFDIGPLTSFLFLYLLLSWWAIWMWKMMLFSGSFLPLSSLCSMLTFGTVLLTTGKDLFSSFRNGL